MTITSITAQELQQRLEHNDKVTIIDVRTPGEFAAVHISGARNIPVESFDAMAVRSMLEQTGGEVIVTCHAGPRAQTAAKKLAEAGVAIITTLDGGMKAWDQQKLPAIRGSGAISVERQMQLTVGMLITLGCALAFWLHPYWIALPAIIGLGLTNAGATGICPLAMFIGIMPWNRAKKASCSLPQAQ